MLDSDQIKWISTHANDDPSTLRLRHGADAAIQHLIMQVESRRKYRKKLSDTLQCEAFEFPTALSGEQSTSDRLARFHTGLITSGSRVADLTAGLGIDTLHFATKAATVTAIERDERVAQILSDNARTLGLHNVTVINADCTEWIKTTDTVFDTVFIDPARRGSNGERIFALNQCAPDVTAMADRIAALSSKLIVKMSPMLDTTQIARELHGVTDMYAIGTADECKELVAVADLHHAGTKNSVMYHAVTLTADGENIFSFSPDDESKATVSYGIPTEAAYLYEPYPAVMKMAPFRLLAVRYGVTPLHPNTHIYASEQLIPKFPGTVMAIDEILPFSSASLKQLQRRHIEASVTTRNFNMNAATLRSRIKARESSSHRLFGLSVSDPSSPLRLILTHVLN